MNKNEIFETLWGYENPQKKLKLSLDAINDANDNIKYYYQVWGDLRKNLKCSVKVMMMDGTSFIVKTPVKNHTKIIDDVVDMVREKTNLDERYAFKFYIKGQEEEVDFYDLIADKEPLNIFVLPYEVPYFQVGMKSYEWGTKFDVINGNYIKIWDKTIRYVYKITRMTKCNLWITRSTFDLIDDNTDRWKHRYGDDIEEGRCKYTREKFKNGKFMDRIKSGVNYNYNSVNAEDWSF